MIERDRQGDDDDEPDDLDDPDAPARQVSLLRSDRAHSTAR